jgi:hypothetical protein
MSFIGYLDLHRRSPYIRKQSEDAFLWELKGLEARQRLEVLVIPKRQALTRR